MLRAGGPLNCELRQVAIELVSSCCYFSVQGIYCKALSLENGQFSGETLFVLSQDLNKTLTLLALGVGALQLMVICGVK